MRMSDWSSDVCSSDLFDMEDLRSQLRQMRNMGGIGALASMIPGLAKAKAAMANNGPDDRLLPRMEAMVGSMTPKERAKPDILNAKRKIRIAPGSGTTVQDVNRLLKMHPEMSTAMKKLRKMEIGRASCRERVCQ